MFNAHLPYSASRRRFLGVALAGSWLALSGRSWAQTGDPLAAPNVDQENLFDVRRRLAVADLRLACEWIARSYEIPVRVPQEMLLNGHDYCDTLIAHALMAKGASFNELMELRAYDRWDQISKKVEIDSQTLPAPIRDLLTFGRNEPVPVVLHYLPDVYVGLSRDLTLNAFTPVVPTSSLVKRFRLDGDEVSNIRKALDDPLGVSEELLLETGGRGGLKVADWVIAGVLTHHKPLAIDTVLAARSGEQLSWSECCMAFGMRPDVLTRGPLSGIYPVLTGSTPGTVLCARRRRQFPERLPLHYDLERMSKDELRALEPLMVRCYRLDAQEQQLLAENKSELAEKGLMAALSRLARVDLRTILDLRKSGQSYRNICKRFSLDLTGQDGVKAVIDAREPIVIES